MKFKQFKLFLIGSVFFSNTGFAQIFTDESINQSLDYQGVSRSYDFHEVMAQDKLEHLQRQLHRNEQYKNYLKKLRQQYNCNCPCITSKEFLPNNPMYNYTNPNNSCLFEESSISNNEQCINICAAI